MANRVVLGNLGSVYGLFVSKPGVNVLSANYSDLLFDSRADWNRRLSRGTATFSLNQTQVNISIGVSLPYTPVVFISPHDQAGTSGLISRVWYSSSGATVTVYRNAADAASPVFSPWSFVYNIYSLRAA